MAQVDPFARFAAQITAAEALLAPWGLGRLVSGDDGMQVGWTWPSRTPPSWGEAIPTLEQLEREARELLGRPEKEAHEAGAALLRTVSDAARTGADAARAAGDSAAAQLRKMADKLRAASMVALATAGGAGVLWLALGVYLVTRRRGRR